jgi:hypothetical protein
MTNPEPVHTARGPAYEGRLLPRPEEEVVDQGLSFDVGTLFSRRRVLAIFGVGAGMATLAACGVGATSSTSQMALPKNACDEVFATDGYEQSVANLSELTLETDNVFGDDRGVHQLGTVTGSLTDGYVATLTVPVDTGTEPTSRNAPQGRGGQGGVPSGQPSIAPSSSTGG